MTLPNKKFQRNSIQTNGTTNRFYVCSEELLELIHTVESQYIIFTDLKAFPVGTNLSEIDTYEAFLASACELILLIVDCSYTSIYCKDIKVLSELYANVESLKVDKLAYITDENDFRNTLRVR